MKLIICGLARRGPLDPRGKRGAGINMKGKARSLVALAVQDATSGEAEPDHSAAMAAPCLPRTRSPASIVPITW